MKLKVILTVYLGDSNRQIMNSTPRPILPSQKAWLEMASDNHFRVFKTLLPQNFLRESQTSDIQCHCLRQTI